MKGAIRLAALMEIPSICVFTHDSIGLGEDGPTHQPIEQLAHLRATARTSTSCARPAPTRPRWPGASPCARPTRPTVFALSRQGLPVWNPAGVPDDAIERGAYVLRESYKPQEPDLILIATGLRGAPRARARPTCSRPTGSRRDVVSMPCWRPFAEQDAVTTATSVLPPGVPRARGGRGGQPARLGALDRRPTATSSA